MGYITLKERLSRLSNLRKGLNAISYAFIIGAMLLVPAHLNAQDIKINETNFPDPIFRAIVDSLAGNTHVLTQQTINSTTSFNSVNIKGSFLSKRGIKSLKGIEYFTELTSLYCQDNPITSIDLSNNKKLTVLNLTGSKVTSLDLSNNTELATINCGQLKTLESINVQKCSNLKKLYLADNKLTELDVTQNPSLQLLSCNNNQLTRLDLSKNTALTKLWVGKNSNLTSLDLSNNTNLEYLSIDNNNMLELKVSMLPKLQTLYCLNNKLTSLDLSKNTALTLLSCYSNHLTSLDLTNNTSLKELYCYKNNISSLALPSAATSKIAIVNASNNALASLNLDGFTNINGSVANQRRRMMLYTDGTDAYMLVGGGIDASKISDAKINFTDNTSKSTSITLSVGSEINDGLVPLKFSNEAARKRLFNWTNSTSKATPITITYNYDTESSNSNLKVMDVTDTVECYLLPMSAEYGTVNLPYDAVLPTGATAYAVSATDIKVGSNNNTATLTQIATEGEIVAANTPMLIRRTDDTHTLFALNQSNGTAKSAGTNLLKGTQNAAINNNENYYVLGINNTTTSPNYGKLGFWRSTNKKIGNWRAYLDLTGKTSDSKGFVLILDSTPDSISDITAKDSDASDPWYTLDGRALNVKPSVKGLYIHNGKKIIIIK